jgi:Lon protease-like protein
MDATPMFPLGSVLFPHTPLALRIFEPRYLTMTGRLLDEEDPVFGVVLIERGFEAGGGDQRSTVGTLAQLVHVEAGADDVYVVAVGVERIIVREWGVDDPYPVASLEAMERLEWDEQLDPLHREAERAVRRVATLASIIGEARWEPDSELSDDPVESAWQLAAMAPLSEYDRFRLLQATTLGGLLRLLIDLSLELEPLLIARIADARDDEDDQPS